MNLSRISFLTEIVLVFILPIELISRGVIPIEYRLWVLFGAALVLGVVMIVERWTLRDIGLNRRLERGELLAYGAFTILGIFLIVGWGERTGQEEFIGWWMEPHFLYLFLVVSALQEFLYRGYLIPALGRIWHSPTVVLVLNTLLFTYLHVIFPNPLIGLPLAFIGGFGFALIYLKYPNLILITLSHAILNFAAVFFGFFTVSGFS